jgi:hypothetical protein
MAGGGLGVHNVKRARVEHPVLVRRHDEPSALGLLPDVQADVADALSC